MTRQRTKCSFSKFGKVAYSTDQGRIQDLKRVGEQNESGFITPCSSGATVLFVLVLFAFSWTRDSVLVQKGHDALFVPLVPYLLFYHLSFMYFCSCVPFVPFLHFLHFLYMHFLYMHFLLFPGRGTKRTVSTPPPPPQ